MSNPLDFTRGRVALIGIALCFVITAILLAIPIAANAAPVNLATAQPFVVLGGAGVTNTGPSVLNGDLGVTPGTSLSGFGAPAVVNGATHANDAVAAQAQADLTTAYNVAAGQPIAPGNELTGVDLGGLTLSPGAYGYSTSAQLTGQLTLDAHGDPNAQFVFVIGSTLTTASASSVILTNGASPCNVFWKIGSSATFGSGTAFEGNVMALTSISLNSGVTVLGRALARNGEVTLINDVLTLPGCATETSTTPTGTETDHRNLDQCHADHVDRRQRRRRQGRQEAREGQVGEAVGGERPAVPRPSSAARTAPRASAPASKGSGSTRSRSPTTASASVPGARERCTSR